MSPAVLHADPHQCSLSHHCPLSLCCSLCQTLRTRQGPYCASTLWQMGGGDDIEGSVSPLHLPLPPKVPIVAAEVLH